MKMGSKLLMYDRSFRNLPKYLSRCQAAFLISQDSLFAVINRKRIRNCNPIKMILHVGSDRASYLVKFDST